LWQRLGAVSRGDAHAVSDDLWYLGIGPVATNQVLDELPRYVRSPDSRSTPGPGVPLIDDGERGPGQRLGSGTRVDDEVVNLYRRWLAEVRAAIGRRSCADRREVARGGGGAVRRTRPPHRWLALAAPAGLLSARLDAGILAVTVSRLLRSTPARTERLLATMNGGARVADRDRLVEWMAISRPARWSLAPPLPNQVLTAWRDTPCRVVAGEHDRVFPPSASSCLHMLRHAGTTVVAGPVIFWPVPPEAVVDGVVADLHRFADDMP